MFFAILSTIERKWREMYKREKQRKKCTIIKKGYKRGKRYRRNAKVSEHERRRNDIKKFKHRNELLKYNGIFK